MRGVHDSDCSEIREAISADADGESPNIPPRQVARHLDRCAGCRSWAESVQLVHRAIRVQPAEPVPDLSAAIVEQALGHDGRRRPAPLPSVGQPVSSWRWALFAVALTQLLLAGPALLLGDGAGDAVHAARELGAFDVALAIGLLVAAWQPARAWGLLPVAAALAVVMAGTAVLDVFDGSASTSGESHHVLDLAGVALLWLVARDEQRPATLPRRPSAAIG